jgi:uncharacterized protein
VDVTADDLTKPLGLDPPRRKRFAFPRIPATPILAGLLVAFAAGVGGFIAVVDDPLGGEPHALVPIETTPAAAQASVAKDSPGSSPEGQADQARRSAEDVESASGVAVVRPQGTSAPGAVVISVPEPEGTKLAPAPDRRLVERTRHGLLPKIGADGARPADVYARPAGRLPGGASPAARVAVLVTGLGISQTATAGAVAKLPPAVTFAFAPYGADLEKNVGRAREAGHEVMLQIPMEPFDYPDNDPGPHTLTVRGKGQDNADKLHWAMGRFTGYTGLVNFMGAKLTADEAALGPILSEIGRRGLAFLDDGSSSRSLVGTVGPASRTPVARADIVLDGAPRLEAIDKELARLEETARRRGFAIGTASALPLTVDRIARWARELESRNILLVPVSSAFAGESRR